MYDIQIDDDHVNHVNKFIKYISETIINIPEDLRDDFISHNVNLLKDKIKTNNDLNNILNYFFEIKKIGVTHSLSKIEKIKAVNNDCDIVLIAQYYETPDEQRKKENTISLINNILNPYITKIHLLNEKLYDIDNIFKILDDSNKSNNYRNKVKQHIIEKRMTFHDAMAFSNKFCKNSIIIVANLDIFFNEDLNKLQSYDFTNLFLSLSRFEMLHDYEFGGKNQVAKFIHNGQLGNPCIDSHDAWIFKTPIKMTHDSKIMLGSLGCDTIINYVYGETMKYNVVNPIDSIMTIHYHRERERDYRTENSVRSHSGIVYNKDNKFNSDKFNHKYILQKSILVCNTIESFCTFATKNAYDDLRLLLHSLEIYHKDIPIFIYCDNYIAEKIDTVNFNLKIHKRITLNKYTDLNRKSMEAQNIFTDFLLNKANVIDFAMENYNNTLFIDADIVILNKMDLLIDKSCDVGLSPHNIFESSQKMYGVYNAGFMYVANYKITNYWRNIVYTKKGFVDQQALDYFEEEFKVFKFDDSYNFGWWRLFQCEDPQVRANLFTTTETNIYYSYKTLKCIHTHLYDTNDPQTTEFNKFILQLLEKINHPMVKFIKNKTLVSTNTNKLNILSLGSSCDGANMLKYFNYQNENKFFDFLWNEIDGLNTVNQIIEDDFKYFDNMENYIYQKNKIIAWEGTEIINKIINKYYPNLLFFHIKEDLNNTHIESFKRKIIRTQEILNNVNHKYFIYYRHYEYCNDLNILINETNNFCNIYIKKYNTKFTLLSLIMVDNTINKDELNTILNKLEKNNTNNIKYSYVYKTDDYNIEKTKISRESWKNVLDKYVTKNIDNENINNKNINNENININNENINNENINNKIDKNSSNKPTIIIPKMPRNDFWNHNNDTFRELLKLWEKNDLIDLVEDDVKHVWYNKVGDILLYDRPTLDWLNQDIDISYNKILFGNPLVPDNLKNKALQWIFWGRSPSKLSYFANMEKNSYTNRKIESIFIGKIENNVQAKYRLQYPNIEKTIQLYIMHKSEEPYRYNQEEYLNLLRQSKFGLCLRGYGPKCNREIELMALGTVPIVASDVDMSYYDSPIENIHYFRFTNVEDIKKIIANCSEEVWTKMSNACIKWYNKNASSKGSFETTQNIIHNFDKLIHNTNNINKTNNTKINEKIKSENIIIDLTINLDKLNSVDDIKDKIIFNFGKEEEFIRPNLKSYFNISKIYELHKKNHNDVLWDNINKFIRVQDKYIAKFENIKINSEGIMYDNENVYTLNNNYYQKNTISKKEIYKFEDDIVVFNCVQKWAYGYYHWLCEIYPRLFYIKLYIENNPHLFVNKKIVLLLYYHNDFIKQFLEILNLKNIVICPYNPNLEYQAPVAYLYTPAFYGNPSKDGINIIRKSLFNNSVCVPKINILIKRNNNRIINNFDAVYNLLKTNYNDYEWIIFDEQDDICKNTIKTIQLFSQANLIIGVHGAGLTNMIFSSPQAKIIELHPDNCGNVCYWHLSHIIENTHTMLLVKSISELAVDVNLEQLDYTVNNLLNDLFCINNI